MVSPVPRAAGWPACVGGAVESDQSPALGVAPVLQPRCPGGHWLCCWAQQCRLTPFLLPAEKQKQTKSAWDQGDTNSLQVSMGAPSSHAWGSVGGKVSEAAPLHPAQGRGQRCSPEEAGMWLRLGLQDRERGVAGQEWAVSLSVLSHLSHDEALSLSSTPVCHALPHVALPMAPHHAYVLLTPLSAPLVSPGSAE